MLEQITELLLHRRPAAAARADYIDEIAPDFQRLFRGRTDAWASIRGQVFPETLTPEHYRRHLEGQRSLGVYPLLDGGVCYFFGVDITEWRKALRLRKEMFRLDIPVFIAESENGGYRVYGFCEEGMAAADVRRLLRAVMRRLNIPGEVFPHAEGASDGGYVHLACFGRTRRLLDTEHGAVPIIPAIKRIRYAARDAIEAALPPLRLHQASSPREMSEASALPDIIPVGPASSAAAPAAAVAKPDIPPGANTVKAEPAVPAPSPLPPAPVPAATGSPAAAASEPPAAPSAVKTGTELKPTVKEAAKVLTPEPEKTDSEKPADARSAMGDLAELFSRDTTIENKAIKLAKQLAEVDINQLLEEGRGFLNRLRQAQARP